MLSWGTDVICGEHENICLHSVALCLLALREEEYV